MVNYQNGIIYRLVSNTCEGQYFGSTANELRVRKNGHKKDWKQWKKGKHNYITYMKLYEQSEKPEDVKILWVEDYPCNSKRELEARERVYIENNECLNKNIPTRSNKEWYKTYYKANKDTIREKHKNYYEANRDTIREKSKDYREANKKRLRENNKNYYKANKDTLREKKKEYYEANKDTLREKYKKYYDDNKKTLREKCKAYYEANRDKIREKHQCECGAVVSRYNLSRHKKSNKHKLWLDENQS